MPPKRVSLDTRTFAFRIPGRSPVGDLREEAFRPQDDKSMFVPRLQCCVRKRKCIHGRLEVLFVDRSSCSSGALEVVSPCLLFIMSCVKYGRGLCGLILRTSYQCKQPTKPLRSLSKSALVLYPHCLTFNPMYPNLTLINLL